MLNNFTEEATDEECKDTVYGWLAETLMMSEAKGVTFILRLFYVHTIGELIWESKKNSF